MYLRGKAWLSRETGLEPDPRVEGRSDGWPAGQAWQVGCTPESAVDCQFSARQRWQWALRSLCGAASPPNPTPQHLSSTPTPGPLSTRHADYVCTCMYSSQSMLVPPSRTCFFFPLPSPVILPHDNLVLLLDLPLRKLHFFLCCDRSSLSFSIQPPTTYPLPAANAVACRCLPLPSSSSPRASDLCHLCLRDTELFSP